MPKSKEYLSSSESDSGSGDSEPKPKKKKPEKKEATKETKGKSAAKSSEEKKDGPTKGSGGEFMFQLAKMRYATVSEFRGKAMVGIREYYEKDGELRPGKKGISLSIDQWQALKDKISEIDDCLKQL
ncbi:activated RNA polymerase II transcriptional coactivator p15-like [Physella acuta]|uniref:activated RNA polymerase II transcriptional coactivator p15-like n=1 Tax=Physella acuta TaxID=109671 RepID=UPI0027DB76A7|nr:activated RNA polymerase II transcriptional coactivator p15-like [Physella acuta]XP_059157887.1 LOW QUALITY PROTEIN: activated RNA polymerase II transcriptional coactivator p15-like [Physella acuta]XP_059174616.1 activated RNA polymerase II transcriptional coactivator p15-like [Physella acuta]XP_059174617.1 activated RNA polymerase II transcriptional coactivator p15-like [Physella acuta]